MIVAQRVSTISTADDILVLEDGVVIGRGHARRADRDMPDLRRDRAVADRREERGRMTLIDDHARTENEELDLSAPETRAGRAVELGRRARRAVEGLQARGAPPGRHARPDVGRARHRRRRRGRERDAQRVRAHACSATAPTSSSRASSSHQGIDFAALHHVLFQAVGAVRGVGGAVARRRRTCSPASSSG